MGGKIVIDHQCITALFHPVFGDGTAGERGEMLQAGQAAGFGDDNRGVFERPGFSQRVDGVDDGGALLANQHIDAKDVLVFLVDNGIQRNRAASQTFITDQQLALAFADRDHRVDDFDTGVEWLLNEVPGSDWWR